MSKDTEALREILGDAIKSAEAESPLLDVDLKNLRFYATQFREHQWQSPWIHWSVFAQTLNEIANRTEELERRFREEFAMRDRYKAQSNSWREKALDLYESLVKIANEAAGFVSMADPMNHGITNIRVLQTRIREASAAIAKAEGRAEVGNG